MIMLGIDVSKTKIDCCIFPQGLTGKEKIKYLLIQKVALAVCSNGSSLLKLNLIK